MSGGKNMMQLTLNNQLVSANEGDTILEVATANHILIPTLCFLQDVHAIGSCRICSVEVDGAKSLMAACITQVTPGMVIRTNTPRVRKARKVLYELMLSDHPADCLHCDRNQSCEFQQVGEILRVKGSRFEGGRSKDFIDD